MDCYRLIWKSSAKKELKRLPKEAIVRIISKIESLQYNLHPSASKKITGSEYTYRLRTGDYRILYSIKEAYLIIEVVRVGHRKDVYKKSFKDIKHD